MGIRLDDLEKDIGMRMRSAEFAREIGEAGVRRHQKNFEHVTLPVLF